MFRRTKNVSGTCCNFEYKELFCLINCHVSMYNLASIIIKHSYREKYLEIAFYDYIRGTMHLFMHIAFCITIPEASLQISSCQLNYLDRTNVSFRGPKNFWKDRSFVCEEKHREPR